MADSTQKQSIDKVLQCPICKNQINDPRVLECQHSYCLQCLWGIICDSTVICVICESKYALPKNSVHGFPKNRSLQNILDIFYPDADLNAKPKKDYPGPAVLDLMRNLTVKNTEKYIYKRLVPLQKELYDLSYYWGDLSHSDAKNQLMDQPNGSFLLRNSSDPKSICTLTFKKGNEISSLRIEEKGNFFRFYDADPKKYNFTSIKTLLDYHRFEKPENSVLKFPINRKSPSSLQQLSRAAICDSISYQDIENLLIPLSCQEYLRKHSFIPRPHIDQDVENVNWTFTGTFKNIKKQIQESSNESN